MRGKQAKKLRRLAETTNLPPLNYVQHSKQKYITLGKCVRRVYQDLKKAYKNGTLTETGSSSTVS